MRANEFMAELLSKFYNLKLEYIALTLFTIISLFIYQLKYYSYIFMVISAVIGSFLFIILNMSGSGKQKNKFYELIEFHNSHAVRYTTNILFFIFYGLSFLMLLRGIYTKTIWYYFFISLCTGLIATEILFIKPKSEGTINLIKTFLLGLNVFLSNQIVFPYGIGSPDSNSHLYNILTPILKNGYIPLDSTVYAYFPGHHILVAINSLIADIDPRMTYYYLGGFVVSIGILFVFLLGRKFFNLHFGLIAALIYVNCEFLIANASHASQLTYSLPLAIMIFTIVMYRYKSGNLGFRFLFPILATAMVFTHHHSPMIFSFVMASILIAEIIQHIEISKDRWIVPNLFLLFVVILFAHWVYYSHNISKFANIILIYHNAFTGDFASSIMTQTIYDTMPTRILLLNSIGSSVLILLSTIGFLIFFKNASFFKNIIMILSIVLIILIGIGFIINVMYLLPQRLYAFLEELGLVFLGASAIMYLFNINRDKSFLNGPLKRASTYHFSSDALFSKSIKALVIVLIVCFSFFSNSSATVGRETSPFMGDEAYRKDYETPYERYSEQWGKNHLPSNYSINKSWSFFNYVHPGGKPSIIQSSKLPITENATINTHNITNDSYVFFSGFDINIGFLYKKIEETGHMGHAQYIKLEKEVHNDLDNNYDKYYDNGVIHVYFKQ